MIAAAAFAIPAILIKVFAPPERIPG